VAENWSGIPLTRLRCNFGLSCSELWPSPGALRNPVPRPASFGCYDIRHLPPQMMEIPFRFAGFLVALLFITGSACSDDVVGEFDATPDPDRSEYPVHESETENFHVVTVAENLEHPWAITWLPDGEMLVTERPGRLVRFRGDERTNLTGLPEIHAQGQGGLLDVQLHPDYESNGWIYYTYSAPCGDGNTALALDRARVDGDALVDRENLYTQAPCLGPGRHYGSRIVFPGDGTVVFTLGDRGERDRAQDINDPSGSTLRLNYDGSVPTDNPFIGEGLDELYTIGNRNAQGMIIHPETGAIWQHEHGPQGGDEINIIEAGKNYGWPAITTGVEYRSGEEIGGTEAPGMEQPVIDWTPSIAPSGFAYYDGDAFPTWRGDLFVGALRQQHLRRVVIDGNEVTHQEELLRDEVGRIRDVRVGPDGYIYLAIDSPEGQILRLEPSQR
jgi:aldose sugar dehydrogenase